MFLPEFLEIELRMIGHRFKVTPNDRASDRNNVESVRHCLVLALRSDSHNHWPKLGPGRLASVPCRRRKDGAFAVPIRLKRVIDESSA